MWSNLRKEMIPFRLVILVKVCELMQRFIFDCEFVDEHNITNILKVQSQFNQGTVVKLKKKKKKQI